MKKQLPKLATDKAAAAFVSRADLTEYDLAAMHRMRFGFQPRHRSGAASPVSVVRCAFHSGCRAARPPLLGEPWLFLLVRK